jgi:hypothetical protein
VLFMRFTKNSVPKLLVNRNLGFFGGQEKHEWCIVITLFLVGLAERVHVCA